MSDLILSKISFKKKALLALADARKMAFIVLAGNLLQEIVIFHKMIAMSLNGIDNTEKGQAKGAQAAFLLRFLANQLSQGWEDLTKPSFRMYWGEFKGALSEEGKQKLQALEQYFSNKDNKCLRIRNKFSSHYDSGEIEKIFNKISEEEDLHVLITDHHANCRFTMCDLIFNFALWDTASLDLGTKEEMLTRLKDCFQNLCGEIIGTAKLFIDVLAECLSSFFVRIRDIKNEELTLTDVSNLDEASLPYYLVKREPQQ